MTKEFVSPSLENTKIEELTMQLMEANTKLTVLQKEREMMLSNISHDLRAPITAIRGALDLALSTDNTKEELLKTLSLIDRRTKTLEDLINDMYYLFCIEDTSRPMELTTLNAGQFLEEYFYDEIVDPRYDSFDMKLEVPDDLSCEISIDTQKFIRVLDNLFTNAAKYAFDVDNPSITLSSYRLSCDTLCICVSDTGHGIPEEAIPKLFNRTFMVSDARTPNSQVSGSGLGLSIAKAIIERHGGTISCESEIEKGTTFSIVIPCAKTQNSFEVKN